MKTALLFRLGGLGDYLILTCVAKELKKRGYEVDACFGSPTADPEAIVGNLGIFRKIYKYGRVMTGLDVYETEDGDNASTELLKDGYDLVVDYKLSIELNSHYRHLSNSPGKEWMVSQNSNYMNWMDMMFAWAGIDPTEIADEDKIPSYKVEDKENEWAKNLLRATNADKVIALQTNASSLVRTWYHPDRLPKAIKEAYGDKGKRRIDFVVFDGNQWQLLRGQFVVPVSVPAGINPMRASAALLANSDLFIGADSGLSHLAEAIGIKSLTIYTTVPAWTRMRYYKHAKAIEPIGKVFNDVSCRPCFVLDRYCPRVREKASGELSPREAHIKGAMEAGKNPAEVAKELNTTIQGILMEGDLMQKRLNALYEVQAPCTMTITPDRIVEAIKEFM